VLLISGGPGDLRVEVLPAPADPWSLPADSLGGRARVGVDALAERLVQAGVGEGRGCGALALLTGPAAERSRHGALLLRQLCAGSEEEADVPAPLVARGGFGSALVQRHGVVAVVLAGAAESPQRQAPEAVSATPAVPPNNLMLLREWLTFFNYRSAFLPRRAREEAYEFLIARGLLAQLEASARSTALSRDCGASCPAPCLRRSSQYRRSDETLLALGPLLGVFDLEAIDALTRFARALGVDVLEGAGALAWLLECLDAGWLEPATLGMVQRPRWEVHDFDSVSDSHHNAALAGALLEHLYLGPPSSHVAPTDLRRFSERLGGDAADAAVFLSRGTAGWLCAAPLLLPDALLPLTLPLRGMLHDRYDYVPPRELGRRAARWMALQLAMANLGVCPERSAWAQQGGLAELERARGGTSSGSWRPHHRDLLRTLRRRSLPHPSPGSRVPRLLGRYLVQAQLNLPPDAGLDRWVARSHRSAAGAYTEYLSAVQAGVEEVVEE